MGLQLAKHSPVVNQTDGSQHLAFFSNVVHHWQLEITVDASDLDIFDTVWVSEAH